ncbi:cysteine/serine-rich nuclear protein 1b [Brienomyrus brachyistius]|uniref:cysteine/serine-rich nuclear protein 1b n=1 Tax=Brienomyrus brachyistius TaxID=42636 RepID=UPI0020B19DFA|nr:cysteine/serine-rich nuclear protein 1b [Brienomyrus brachyistius]XP_048878899.1 cysteine/serine-rich nuclear protein 1b [Brienomyrus brachyistius]
MSGPLKRKFSEVDEDRCYSSSSPSSLSSPASSEWDSDGGSFHSDTLDSRPSAPSSPEALVPTTSILKKAKRPRKGAVQFDQVIVYYFPRCQGFSSVPSRGGCTLGMVREHSACHRYTLAEFALEQRHLRWEKIKDRLKEEKLEGLRQKLTKNGTQDSEEASKLTVEDISDEDLDLGGVDLGDSSSLQPYPSKRRHALLKAAGVKKIDREEKRHLHAIRLSREDCGCDCQGFCEPETCTCSLAGIKCQMDHSSFPCGCTKDGCGNTEGRIEFNSGRVQTHYIHTIMKLELEKRLEEESSEVDTLGLSSVEEDSEVPPVSPSFHFSPELAAAGDNSCSSDMTDSSSSSLSRSEDLETGRPPRPARPALDVDDDGLARILSFGDSDNEDCPGSNDGHQQSGQWQQRGPPKGPAGFVAAEPFSGNGMRPAVPSDCADNRVLTISEMLDENANQGSVPPSTGPLPGTLLPSLDHTNGLMDLSLSSGSDLEFFEGFPSFRHNPMYGSLKDYENLDDNFQFQFPNYPNLPQVNDSGTCLLESLIGLSDCIPEPSTAFTDNQLLEEAMKSSVSESLKV